MCDLFDCFDWQFRREWSCQSPSATNPDRQSLVARDHPTLSWTTKQRARPLHSIWNYQYPSYRPAPKIWKAIKKTSCSKTILTMRDPRPDGSRFREELNDPVTGNTTPNLTSVESRNKRKERNWRVGIVCLVMIAVRYWVYSMDSASSRIERKQERFAVGVSKPWKAERINAIVDIGGIKISFRGLGQTSGFRALIAS